MGPLWWDLGGCEVLTLEQFDIFTFKVGYPPSKLKDFKQYIFIHISASRCPIDIIFVSKDTSVWSLHIIGHFLELDIRRPSWNPRWRPQKFIFFERRSKVLPDPLADVWSRWNFACVMIHISKVCVANYRKTVVSDLQVFELNQVWSRTRWMSRSDPVFVFNIN